jgi:hypothetical protein
MNSSNCKYFCLLKGNWQERFFELIELFQISLHKKFAIGVPENVNNEYNRIVIYGISESGNADSNKGFEITDEEIFNSFYNGESLRNEGSYNVVPESESTPANFFENQMLYN